MKFPTITLVLQPINVEDAMQPCGMRKEITKETGLQIQHSHYAVNKNYHRIGSLLPKDGTQPRDWCHSHTSVNVELRLISKRTNSRQYNAPTVAEVSALKYKPFMRYLVDHTHPNEDKDIDGREINQDTISVSDFVYVIKFQKLGLPHAHNLLWLEEHCKCKTPGDIDDIISAELPSPMDDPAGYKAVTDYILHGPCGKDASYAAYNVEGKCLKHFSKAFCVKTIFDQDGYPIYHQRDNKVSDKKALLKREVINVTMFTDWFDLNERHPPARTLTYAEILQHYVWHEQSKIWKPRKQRKCISRIYSTPASGDRYFLRMLLNVVKGPRTFEELLTVKRRLNPEQRVIYEEVVESVHNKKRLVLLCLWARWHRKDLLIQDYHFKAKIRTEDCTCHYFFRIASLLLPARRTIHTRFVILLELLENSTCGIKQNTHLAELMQEVELIIWDEAPMTQKYAFEALDKTLRDILGYPTPENRKKKSLACINRSKLWKHCKVFTLTRSMRVNEYYANGEIDTRKQDFNQWVLAVGDGKLPAKIKDGEDEPTWIEIPETFLINSSNSPIEQIVAETYPNFIERQRDDAYLRERAILTPRNDDVDAINAYMFDKLEGESVTYNSADEESPHPYALSLKKELPIMLLRNVNPSQGLSNGTRLIITELGEFVLKAKILTGSNVGDTVVIHRIILTSTQSKWPFVLKQRQYPVRPCYAMTINKSQGQSLNYVSLYLPNPLFSHGKLYVALSRVTNPDGLKILMKEDEDKELKHCTRNIVYKEAFNCLT
ncbi:ATP-dependent DNA helicase PIF1-like protein [Tanacetum coccineum]|uniref:ATP-dependent DNA helicase n=1 Tax=Tanacetum coccineum TaxID=301880 RepID=A0ABQ5A9B4_9ASTR